jgi:hypothetical protein
MQMGGSSALLLGEAKIVMSRHDSMPGLHAAGQCSYSQAERGADMEGAE